MKVILLTKYNNQGGVVAHIVALANELVNQGHQVTVCAPLLADGGKGLYTRLRCRFINIDFSTKNPMKILKNMKCLLKLANSGIDIIHSHNRSTSLYAEVVSKITKVPFIWTMHSSVIPRDYLHRKSTFYGQKAICVSTDAKRFANQELNVPEKDIEVIFNGIDENVYIRRSEKKVKQIKNSLNLQEDDKIIVLLSRLDPEKGHLKAIEALNKCSKKEKLKILFTGESLEPGYKKILLNRIKSYQMEDNFLFVGYVDPVDILSVASLSILPSDQEGFPYSVIESFLLKVPVIRTNTGGYYDVKDYCFLMKNEDDLAHYFNRFTEGSLDVDEMVRNAYEFVMRNCTCKVMTDKILNVYKQAAVLNK